MQHHVDIIVSNSHGNILPCHYSNKKRHTRMTYKWFQYRKDYNEHITGSAGLPMPMGYA